jgi:hypothetical protein
MRTKTLYIAAAALAVSVASSMAQAVHSQNVVGYVNIPAPANQYILMANQLNTTNNTIGSLLPSVPAGTILQKFSGGYTAYVFDEFDLSWTPDANGTLNPGEGAFFRSPSATTLTFVGEVRQGNLTNTLPIGAYAIRASIVPQAGPVSTTLGLPGEAGDILQTFSGGYTAYVFDEFDLSWTPSEPNISVGQAFFYRKANASTQGNWVRNFTVN